MIVRFQILAVLLCLSFHAFATPSEDIQTCIDLCNNCNGKTLIEDGKCECSIDGNDKKGADCMKRMAKDAEKVGFTIEVPPTVAEGEGRSVRCLLGSRRKYGQEDVQRVAQYFMRGGPLTGSPLKQPCDPSEKMIGASKSDLKELFPSSKLELPKLPSTESKEPTLGVAKENPWCPSSVFGKSKFVPVQPASTYSTSDGILGSTQQSQKSQVLCAQQTFSEPRGFLGSLQLQVPQSSPADSRALLASSQWQFPQIFTDSTGILGASQLQLPLGISADSGGILGSSQLQQPLGACADSRKILGNIKLRLPQIDADSRGILGNINLRLPEIEADPRDMLGTSRGNIKLRLPQISADSEGNLRSSPLDVSADSRGILENIRLRLPQISTDFRDMMEAPRENIKFRLPQIYFDSEGNLGSSPLDVSADSRGILENIKLRLPQIDADPIDVLGAPRGNIKLRLPQIFGDPRDMMGAPRGNIKLRLPQIYTDPRDLMGAPQGNIKLRLPQISADPNDMLGAPRGNIKLRLPQIFADPRDMMGAPRGNIKLRLPQMYPDPRVPEIGAARKTEISSPKKASQIVSAAKNDCGESRPKVAGTKNIGSDVVGAAKKTELNTPKKIEIVGAAKKDEVVGIPKKAKGVVCATKKTTKIVDASQKTPEISSESNLGTALPVQPGYTNKKKISYSTPKTSLPQTRVFTLNDLVAALSQRSMSGISNSFGRIQIPRYQVGEAGQVLGASRSNSNCNNDPYDLEISGQAAPLLDNTELQTDDESIVGTPFRPRIGPISRMSWIPQALTSVVGIFQPLVEQGVQLAVKGLSGQVRMDSPQVGMARSQLDLNSPQVGLATPETNLGTFQIPTFNSPLGLSAQYLPNSNSYLINSQLSLPILPEPNSPTVGVPGLSLENNCPDLEGSFDDELMVGAPRRIWPYRISQNRIGLKRIGQELTRPGALTKLAGKSLRTRLGNPVRKISREINENSKELQLEEFLNSEANAKTTDNPMEETIKKEIETLEKPEEQKLVNYLQKNDKPEIKLTEPKEEAKTVEKTIEKSVEKVTEKVPEKITLNAQITEAN